MHDPRAIAEHLETYVKSGFGEEAESIELDCLAIATCFDKTNDEHKEHTKLAKKALKKHASDPVLAALKRLSRRNYFPKAKPTQSVFWKEAERFDDFEDLVQIDGFDYGGYAGRLVALYPKLLPSMLSRRNLALFEAYFERGHRGDELTFEDAKHGAHWRFDHRFSKAEVEILAKNPRFTRIEIHLVTKNFALPIDLSAWENLESLTVRGFDITSISQAKLDSIGSLPKLTHLALLHRLEKLPKSLRALSNIEVLDLSGNCLTELPESFSALGALEKLSLSGCSTLTTITDAIGDLKSLTELDLFATRLSSCSRRLGELSGLRTLEVSHLVETEDFFDILGELSGLEHLTLKQTPNVERLPDSIGRLTSLRTLHIEDFDDTFTFFEGLGNLTELVEFRVIDLRRIDNAELAFGELAKLSKLEIFHLKETSLEGYFPSEIVHCSKLRELVLSDSYAGAPPEDIGKLENLEVLDLRNIVIERWPESFFELTKLRRMWLGGHRGSAPNLPDAVGALSELVYLDLDGSRMNALPDALVDLENLEYLNLSFTRIASFPPEFERLTKLTRVDGTGGLGDTNPTLKSQLPLLGQSMPWCRFWNFC